MPASTAPLPTGDEKVVAVRNMFDSIAPRYDLVNRLMTFGLDVAWRKQTMGALQLKPGSLVADLACGTGDFCREIRKRGHVPLGFDLAYGMLAAARTDAQLVHADALRLPLVDDAVDAVTCGYALRNFVDLPLFFAELARIVRPGGRIGLLDVGTPRSALIGRGYNFYFGKVVPRIGGLLSDPAAYSYLPRSVAYLPPTETMIADLEEVGFTSVEHRELTGGLSQLFTATRA